jgi:Endoribonuclease L-PSP
MRTVGYHPRMSDVLTAASVPDAPRPVGPYSPAVIAGNLVFVSGQSGRDPRTDLVGETIEAPTDQALLNISTILEAAGTSLLPCPADERRSRRVELQARCRGGAGSSSRAFGGTGTLDATKPPGRSSILRVPTYREALRVQS